jgi:hypothetical protein
MACPSELVAMACPSVVRGRIIIIITYVQSVDNGCDISVYFTFQVLISKEYDWRLL